MKSVVVEIRPFLDAKEVLSMLGDRRNEQCFRLEFIRISMALDGVRASFEGLWRVYENGWMERAIGSVPKQLWTIDVTLPSNLAQLLLLRARKHFGRTITIGLTQEDGVSLPSGRIMIDVSRILLFFPYTRFRFFGPFPGEEVSNIAHSFANSGEIL